MMAIDQYGHTYHGLTHPRKDLCERLGVSHVEKTYVDSSTGPKHIGYTIGGLWLTVYQVTEWIGGQL